MKEVHEAHLVELTDDLDGGQADETITFGLDGHTFEVDLSMRNAEKLREKLEPYTSAGAPSRNPDAQTR